MASTLHRGGRPSRADLAAAVDKLLPDVIAPGLDVLLCGINPGLWSAATGHHFARPGNRFWPALHRGGFTPRQLRPDEQDLLIGHGLGITNLAARATARADELTREELTAGGAVLREKVERFAPAWLAVLGVTAFRTAFGARRVTVGPQDGGFGGARLWILPNPSGLNAHFTLDALAAEFAALRRAVAAGAGAAPAAASGAAPAFTSGASPTGDRGAEPAVAPAARAVAPAARADAYAVGPSSPAGPSKRAARSRSS